MGDLPPMFSAAEALPSSAILAASYTSPWPNEPLWDNSVSSMVVGGEARGGVSLSTVPGSSEFPEDDDSWGRSRGGLKHTIPCVKTTIIKTGYVYSVLGYLQCGQGL